MDRSKPFRIVSGLLFLIAAATSLMSPLVYALREHPSLSSFFAVYSPTLIQQLLWVLFAVFILAKKRIALRVFSFLLAAVTTLYLIAMLANLFTYKSASSEFVKTMWIGVANNACLFVALILTAVALFLLGKRAAKVLCLCAAGILGVNLILYFILYKIPDSTLLIQIPAFIFLGLALERWRAAKPSAPKTADGLPAVETLR